MAKTIAGHAIFGKENLVVYLNLKTGFLHGKEQIYFAYL